MDDNEKAFLNFLGATQRIDMNGRLDLEYFSFHFAQSLSLDGLSDSIRAQNLCELMVALILENELPPKDVRYIQQFEIEPWSEDLACVYPNKKRTVIHVGALIIVWDKWLKGVGKLIEIESEVWFHTTEYIHKVSWLLPEHQFTYALFKRVDLELTKLRRNLDQGTIEREGYSPSEAFTLSVQTDSDYGETKRLIRFLNNFTKK